MVWSYPSCIKDEIGSEGTSNLFEVTRFEAAAVGFKSGLPFVFPYVMQGIGMIGHHHNG